MDREITHAVHRTIRADRPTIRAAHPSIHAGHEVLGRGNTSLLAAIIVLAAFALLGSAASRAASADALARFSEANAAFAAEDFSRARALYELALEAGMEGPVIHYNIGAAAFRGGDLPRAERAFREVARTPSMAAVAHYNLGLIALERRDSREARDWFEQTIQQDAPDERLKALASRRLEELPESRLAQGWSYYTRGGFGYDDNIALRSGSVESSATGEADSFGELILAGSYSFGRWRVDTAAATVEYIELDEFSQSAFSLGVARGFALEKWYFELGLSGARLSLGGDVFEQDVAAAFQASRVFSGESRIGAQIRATNVEGKGLFTGLTGKRKEVGLYYDKHWRSWNLGVHARGEDDDSEDPVFAMRSVQFGADARYAWTPMWGFIASAALRRTSHPVQLDGTSGWDDNRATFLLGATRSLWKRAQLFVRVEHERNDSPMVGYDYDRNRITASLEAWH